MKKILLLIFACSFIVLNAEVVREYKIRFSLDDFSIESNNCGITMIKDLTGNATRSENPNLPDLPLFSYNYALPSGTIFESFSYSVLSSSTETNVNLQKASPSLRVGGSESLDDICAQYDENEVVETCKYVSTSELAGVKIAHFVISPFEYYEKTMELKFNNSICLKIRLKEEDIDSRHTTQMSHIDFDFLREIVKNPDDVSLICSQVEPQSDSSEHRGVPYVIITNSALKPYFEPLAKWKTTKGVNTKVVDIDDIRAYYSNSDWTNTRSTMQLIKGYMADFGAEYGTKYFLLGGDDTIIPAPKCLGVSYEKTETGQKDYVRYMLPTDLYYACHDKEFFWDTNKDGVLGGVDDDISMLPNCYVSRAPVRTPSEVKSFVQKTIRFERFPEWNNNILMAGKHLNRDLHTSRDAEIQGDLMYNTAIKPYWTGNLVRMYDTSSDVPSSSRYFTPYMLNTQLTKGYSFVSIITHGGQDNWECENWMVYTAQDAIKQANYGGNTIITTMSCSTNAFDSTEGNDIDPCLSESFIRNLDSGVVAYFGSSRYGYTTYSTTTLGTSLMYESELYKMLFKETPKNKNWGMVTALSKAMQVHNCRITSEEESNTSRWLQFAINPIGDPEMPIFTCTPDAFDEAILHEDLNGITIDTNSGPCRICIMSADDEGDSFYKVYEDAETIHLDEYPNRISVCITQQDMVPLLYEYTSRRQDFEEYGLRLLDGKPLLTSIGNGVSTSLSYSIEDKRLHVTAESLDKDIELNLVLCDLRGTIVKSVSVPIGGDYTVDIATVPNGYYSASVYASSNVLETITFFKK